jgi:hypothetical protein
LRRVKWFCTVAFLLFAAVYAGSFGVSVKYTDSCNRVRFLLWEGNVWVVPGFWMPSSVNPLLQSGGNGSGVVVTPPVIEQITAALLRAGVFGYPIRVPLWMFLVLFGLVGGRLWLVRSRDPYACKECGYNLTGNTSGVCPECGYACMPDKRRPEDIEAARRP